MTVVAVPINEVKLIDLHLPPKIPDGCINAPTLHVKTRRLRCSPKKIMLLSRDEILAITLDEVLVFFKCKEESCVANVNVRDFYKDNPETVPSNWSGRIIFAGTFFLKTSTTSCLVVPYLMVEKGKVTDSGEIPIDQSLAGDFFAYYSC